MGETGAPMAHTDCYRAPAASYLRSRGMSKLRNFIISSMHQLRLLAHEPNRPGRVECVLLVTPDFLARIRVERADAPDATHAARARAWASEVCPPTEEKHGAAGPALRAISTARARILPHAAAIAKRRCAGGRTRYDSGTAQWPGSTHKTRDLTGPFDQNALAPDGRNIAVGCFTSAIRNAKWKLFCGGRIVQSSPDP
jgi:hypothetical protein